MIELKYYVVDVFTDQPFAGNPTAVVMGADGLDAKQLQLIAREFNLSETTFVMNRPESDAAIGIRWFTPTCEVDMCGHGTIGAVHALIHSGRYTSLPDDRGTILPIQTNKTVLTVRCERVDIKDQDKFLVWLDLARPVLKKKRCIPGLWSEMLGVDKESFDDQLPSMQTQDGDVLVFFKTLQPMLDANPDMAELAKFSKQQMVRGWCLASTATLAPSIDVHSRFLAPAVGIDQDPVTGSVHGPLAAYLASAGHVHTAGNTALLSCVQTDTKGRGGLVRAVAIREQDQGYRVRISGECVVTMEGTLFV